MVVKPAKIGGAIWLYRWAFCHRISDKFSFSDDDLPFADLQDLQGSVRKKQWGKRTKPSAMSELALAQNPRALPPSSREYFPVLLEHAGQHPSADASDMVSFGPVEKELLDYSMSLIASDAEEMLGSIVYQAQRL